MLDHHRRRISTTRQPVRWFEVSSMPGRSTPVVDQCILVYEPSGTAFKSLLQLAVFYKGWTAAHGAGEGDERATDAGRVWLL